MTASIGILTGIGFYFPAGIATVLTLGILSVFRWIEQRMPSEYYANFVVRFPRESVLPEAELRKLIAEHGFNVTNLSYRIAGGGASSSTRWFSRPCTPRIHKSSRRGSLPSRL